MLAWRSIAAADVTAFGTSAQMQPPSVRCQAFDATCTAWFRVQIDAFSFTLHACLLLCAEQIPWQRLREWILAAKANHDSRMELLRAPHSITTSKPVPD
jgi:hypothetical protein